MKKNELIREPWSSEMRRRASQLIEEDAYTYAEIADLLTVEFEGEKVFTSDAVRNQYRRGHLDDYLNQNYDSDVQVTKAQGHYHYDEKSDTYVFPFQGKVLVYSSDEIREMKTRYSSLIGQGATIKEICKEFGITERAFQTIRLALGWVHDMPDYLERDLDIKSIEELAEDSIEKYQSEAQWRKYFEEKKIQAIESEYRKLKEEEYLFNTALESIKESIPALQFNPPSVGVSTSVTQSEKTFVLCLSDFHEQLKIYAEEMMYGLGYDIEIRKQIIYKLLEDVLIDVTKNLQYDFSKVVFIEGGDNLDGLYGRTVRGTPRQEQDSKGLESLDDLKWMYRTIIYGLYDIFGEVDVEYVPGNHEGLVTHLIFEILKEHFQQYDGITVNTHKKVVRSFIIGSNQFVIYHGKHPGAQGRMISTSEGAARVSGIQSLFLLTKDDYTKTRNHYFLQGDLHYNKGNDQGLFEEHIIPSVSPPDKYAESLGLFSRPSTVAFIIDDYDGLIWERRYYFDQER